MYFTLLETLTIYFVAGFESIDCYLGFAISTLTKT